jgi:nucleoside-diphosphate-sugar epimerase
MAWAAMARPQRIIHISSSSVYGFILDGEGAIDESQPLLPGNIYGITKLAAEQIALRLAQLANLHLVAARLSGPYGPMERPSADRKRLSPIHDWCVAAAKGEPILVQQEYGPRDFSYMADTADAIYQLATAPAPRHTIYNVTSGVVVTGEEIVSTLQRIVPGLQIRRSDVPGVNLITRPISIDRLTADTGWKPRYDLQNALADYVGWLRQHHARFSAER